MKLVQSFAALACLFACGCSSMGNGVFALEVNTVVLDEYEVKDPVPGSDFRDEDIEVEGIGLKGAINSPVLDFVFGYERRELADQDADELSAGVRKRLLDVVALQPYLELRLLYGRLDTAGEEMDYAGGALGGGLLFNITDNLFLDGNLSYEVLSDVDVGPEDTPFRGLLGRVGIGWSF